jgi:hypothetical protein
VAVEYVSGATKIADVHTQAAHDNIGSYIGHLDLNGIDTDGILPGQTVHPIGTSGSTTATGSTTGASTSTGGTFGSTDGTSGSTGGTTGSTGGTSDSSSGGWHHDWQHNDWQHTSSHSTTSVQDNFHYGHLWHG